MQIATQNELKTTRLVEIGKIFPATRWSKQESKFIPREGFTQVEFSSMIGKFKHDLPNDLFEKADLNYGDQRLMTYTIRESVNQYGTLCCYIKEVLNFEPVS